VIKGGYYLNFVLLHSFFIGNLLLRDYFKSLGWEYFHTATIAVMWMMLLFFLLRWDYILPIRWLNTKYTIEDGRLIQFSSKLNFFIYKIVIWFFTVTVPLVLILMGLNINPILVLYFGLFAYLFMYLNRRVLFEGFDTYIKRSDMTI